jgi:hypothetical protein
MLLHELGLIDRHPEPGDLASVVATDVVRAGAATDRVLSELSANPMSVDIEASLDRSPAQTRRLLQRYALPRQCEEFMNWRHQRNLWRIYIGAFLMTSPRAETAAVARLLGYRSAAAFCHAFANAGLPSPGNVRQLVRELA